PRVPVVVPAPGRWIRPGDGHDGGRPEDGVSGGRDPRRARAPVHAEGPPRIRAPEPTGRAHRLGDGAAADRTAMNLRPWVKRRFPVVPNYRGEPVAVWLGVPLMVAIVAWRASSKLLSWPVHGNLV